MSYKIKFGRIRGILMDNKQLNIYKKPVRYGRRIKNKCGIKGIKMFNLNAE